MIQDKTKAKSPVDDFVSRNREPLYNFQKENVEKFQEANGRLCIFDEMGLGKTPSSIAIAHIYDLFPCVVICKSGLRFQWEQMFYYWGNEIDEDLELPKRLAQVIENGKDTPLPGRDCYIVSYDLLPSLKPDFFQSVGANGNKRPLEIKLAIIDECQHIKNPESQRTRSVFEICKGIRKHRIHFRNTNQKPRGRVLSGPAHD